MIRESFVIGEAEARVEMSREHRHLLGTLLSAPKPPDRVIYEYALETLAQFLAEAKPALADAILAGVARTIIAVARRIGRGLPGPGSEGQPGGTGLHQPHRHDPPPGGLSRRGGGSRGD